MLDLRRLRLLCELSKRGTIASVADALQYTPSAVSQQLAALEREAGTPLLERFGRNVRLTDAALVLVEHSEALLERAARADADLASASGTIAGRGRIAAFESVALHLALPAMQALGRQAPRLRCELIEAEPEHALPALALGDVDLVLADEWQHQPLHLPRGIDREDLFDDPVYLLIPGRHPAARRHQRAMAIAELADDAWSTGHPGMAWNELTRRTCRTFGGFEPQIRHHTNDAAVSVALVAHGLAVALLPRLPLPNRIPHVAVRPIAGASITRTILAATRAADRTRPSTQALLAAIRDAAAARRDK